MAYTDFDAVYTFSAAEVDLLCAEFGNRAENIFNAMAPYGGTTTDVPLPHADKDQVYTLDTAAKVEDVLRRAGPQGNQFFDYMLTLAGAPV
jgi:hypothetical protein